LGQGVGPAPGAGPGLRGPDRQPDGPRAGGARSGPAPEPGAPGGSGTGPSKANVPPVEVSPLRGTREKMSRLRKIVAKRMVESLQTSAQLTTVLEVDVTRVAQLRAKAKADFQAREGVKLTFLPFFTLAATEALKQ